MMKKPILLLIALALVTTLPACGKKKVPPPPPPPAPVAPSAPSGPPPPRLRRSRRRSTSTRDQGAPRRRDREARPARQRLLRLRQRRHPRERAGDAGQERDLLKKYDFLRVTIEGHCDERGTIEYNIALGERRAQVAIDYLVSLGVPRERLKNVSYGKEVPCAASRARPAGSRTGGEADGDVQDPVADARGGRAAAPEVAARRRLVVDTRRSLAF